MRNFLLTARRTRTDRRADDAAVRDALVALATGRSTVAGYVPLGTEPGGAALPGALAAVCGRLLVPVLRPDLDLDWAAYHGAPPGRETGRETGREPGAEPGAEPGGEPGTEPGSEPGAEPGGGAPGPLGVAAITEAELVIVPAVAVDRSGVRLGRGGGSYDRALARVPAETLIIAALYRDEFVDALPFEAHDLRVGAVATPEGVIRL